LTRVYILVNSVIENTYYKVRTVRELIRNRCFVTVNDVVTLALVTLASSLLIMNVPDEGYSTHAYLELDSISTFY